MNLPTVILTILALTSGGWMLFDGGRALLKGSFVTIGGQLGPWTKLVRLVRLDPNSRDMKLIFMILGAATIASLGLFLTGNSWGRSGLMATAILSLWFIPFGTISAIGQLILLVFFV